MKWTLTQVVDSRAEVHGFGRRCLRKVAAVVRGLELVFHWSRSSQKERGLGGVLSLCKSVGAQLLESCALERAGLDSRGRHSVLELRKSKLARGQKDGSESVSTCWPEGS